MSSKPDNTEETGERIAKRLARAGLCSRRDAERWIAEGRVAVNGETLTSPAVVVKADDVIAVNGNPLPDEEPTRLWRYHKPAGLVTTARDEKGRPTVFEKLPPEMPRVISIGRLDLSTEGLLLLTNDGELARHLELPATAWLRRYRVRVHGTVDPRALERLAKGVTIDGVQYGPIEATLDREQGSNAWITMGLREGKNREIRKVVESLNLQVTRLIRVAYGPFQLGKLPRGAVEEVPRRVMRDQMGAFIKHADKPITRPTPPPERQAFAEAAPKRPPSAKRAREAVDPSAFKPAKPKLSLKGKPGAQAAAKSRLRAAVKEGSGEGHANRRRKPSRPAS
ncbi:MAG TPA: pseudouridine synthase [Azospirillaceae bacterium]|nr:pseudouridine synthase [Azospirillaceae bacterium]